MIPVSAMPNHPLYKTGRCQVHLDRMFDGGCPRGDACPFAHSEDELRSLPDHMTEERYLFDLQVITEDGQRLLARGTAPKSRKSEAKRDVAVQCIALLGCFLDASGARLCSSQSTRSQPAMRKQDAQLPQELLGNLCYHRQWRIEYDRLTSGRVITRISGGMIAQQTITCAEHDYLFQATVHTGPEPLIEHGDAPKHLERQAKADVALQCIDRLGYVVAFDGTSLQRKSTPNPVSFLPQALLGNLCPRQGWTVEYTDLMPAAHARHVKDLSSEERCEHPFYKTNLCTFGACQHAQSTSDCFYAHGTQQLRPVPQDVEQYFLFQVSSPCTEANRASLSSYNLGSD